MKKVIFFDLDGTLTDPSLGITNSVMYALRSYGIEENDREKLYPFIGPPLVDSFEKYYGFPEEKGREATFRFQEYFSQKGLYENEVYEGIAQMLSALKEKGLILSLATSKPEEFAVRILEHFDLKRYFDFVCGAAMDEKTRCRKDDVLLYALEKTGADPSLSVMVGDREYDVLAGNKFGLSTVGVLYGFGDRKELENAGADRIAQSVSELKEILMQ